MKGNKKINVSLKADVLTVVLNQHIRELMVQFAVQNAGMIRIMIDKINGDFFLHYSP
jgi:hypothetical protein